MDKNNEQEVLNQLKTIMANKNSTSVNSTAKGKTGFKLSKDMLILIVLVVLVGVSIAQTAKLSNLQSSGGRTGVNNSAPASGSGGGSLPASLQNLPSQVGGC